MSRPIEVLAPAGSPDALIAAVRCGAAAVYLGVGDFNARRSAHNFTLEQLRDAVEYCHIRGVAVHLALNTLVSDAELPHALKIAEFACKIGVDALIVQDVGFARLLRQAAPSMSLHASTQLSCHSPSGVDFLREAGFSRVVLSREMSRDEIAACMNRGVEIEVFVHGALCMSVSGQCYFSAMLGGRSGNRGMCAQPCRLPFSPTDDVVPKDAQQAALSLKDQCLIQYMQELQSLGVASVKIEGRMKRPEYVAAATEAYSRAAKGVSIDESTLTTLQSVFSRSGFTDGYYTGRRGSSMFGIRRKEDVTAAADVLRMLARSYDKEAPLVDVSLTLTANEQTSRLTVTDKDNHVVSVTAEGSEPALNRPIDPIRVEEQLRKSGNTPYRVVDVAVDIPPHHTMPLSRINALRRDALEMLSTTRSRVDPIPFSMPTLSNTRAIRTTSQPKIVLRLASESQWSPALTADVIILPLSTNDDTIRLAASTSTVAVELPRGIFGTEDTVRDRLFSAKRAGATAAMVSTVNGLNLAVEAGLSVIGGFGLNIYNNEALRFYADNGLCSATLSMELTLQQIAAMDSGIMPIGAMVYGRQPLMLTRNCPRSCASANGCVDCHHQGITDRIGTVFPVMCQHGCADVLNSVPLYWLDKLNELPPLDYHLYYFTTESADEVSHIANTSPDAITPPAAITRGLYKRGVK